MCAAERTPKTDFSTALGGRSESEKPHLVEMGLDLHILRADDEIRTRDPHLGKVMLYQLSYVRSGYR